MTHAHLQDPDLYERFYSVDYEPGGMAIARPREPRLQWAVRHIPEWARVLDVGCYKGSVAIPLWQRRRDLTITGIDISAHAIEDAREFARRLEIPITYHVGRAERLPFDDHAFDAVLLFEILEHVADPTAVIAEAKRVGGSILISSPVGAIDMEHRTEKRIPGFEHLDMHVREYDPAVELAGWPGMVTERQSIDEHFSFYLALLP